MFNPKRLTLARARRGYTKRRLAESLGIDERSVLRFEKGEMSPTEENLNAIARELGFPAPFFELDAPPQVRPRAASFRSLSTKTKRQQESVLAAGAIAVEFSKLLATKLKLPTPAVPDLRDVRGGPEDAAQAVRTVWRLGNKPISNMVHLLEAQGIRVFSLVEDCVEVDAFTMRYEGNPYVFLNTLKSAERGRFDAAHELGHLILHAHGKVTGKEIEQEADAFASAFLMPRSDVLAHARRFPNVADLIELKQRWGVSVGALARRLRDLGVVREWHYKQLCIEISRNGFRRQEPRSRPREVSQLLRKALELLKERGVTRKSLADELHISLPELDALIFGLALTPVQGGGGPGQTRTPVKGTLRLVK